MEPCPAGTPGGVALEGRGMARSQGVWPWGVTGIGGTRARGRWSGLQGNLTLLHPERCRDQAGRRGCAALATSLRGPCAVGENSLSFGAALLGG